jgi:hypothetical protein
MSFHRLHNVSVLFRHFAGNPCSITTKKSDSGVFINQDGLG